ncbi:MAG TPA: hypothetical protein VFQ39_11870 [Longimicrobium sp.]|nr:hypothetical protein [Longimicrobium sp.]
MESQLTRRHRARFGPREILPRAEAYRAYWSDFPEREVAAFFDPVAEEYDLPAGLLRPGDRLELLLEPVSSRNPLKWLSWRAHGEDAASELSYQLKRRKFIPRVPLTPASTLHDYLSVWCGREPSSPAGATTGE